MPAPGAAAAGPARWSATCRRRWRDCNEALRLRPDFVHALDSRAFVHLKSGRYDEAITDYDAALRIDPNKAASLYGRGMAKRRKHDFAGGNTDIGAARTVRADISAEFARYGISPPLSDPPTRREAEVTIHRGADPRPAQRPF